MRCRSFEARSLARSAGTSRAAMLLGSSVQTDFHASRAFPNRDSFRAGVSVRHLPESSGCPPDQRFGDESCSRWDARGHGETAVDESSRTGACLYWERCFRSASGRVIWLQSGARKSLANARVGTRRCPAESRGGARKSHRIDDTAEFRTRPACTKNPPRRPLLGVIFHKCRPQASRVSDRDKRQMRPQQREAKSGAPASRG